MNTYQYFRNFIARQLGDKYEVYLNDGFQDKFTTPVPQINGQMMPDINWQAFEQYANKIVAVINISPANYAVAPFLAIDTQYTINFWCPVNYKSLNNSKNFNVEDDWYNLYDTYKDKVIELDNNLRCIMTFGPLISQGGQYDRSGSYRRRILTATGLLNITDKGMFGYDTKVEFGLWNEDNDEYDYYELKGYASSNFSSQPQNVAYQEQAKLIPEQDVEVAQPFYSFVIDDYQDNTDKLRTELVKLAYGIILKLDKIPIKITRGTMVLEKEYNITAQLTHARGQTSIGTITVTCTRVDE